MSKNAQNDDEPSVVSSTLSDTPILQVGNGAPFVVQIDVSTGFPLVVLPRHSTLNVDQLPFSVSPWNPNPPFFGQSQTRIPRIPPLAQSKKGCKNQYVITPPRIVIVILGPGTPPPGGFVPPEGKTPTAGGGAVTVTGTTTGDKKNGKDGSATQTIEYDVVVDEPIRPNCFKRTITHVFIVFIWPPMKPSHPGEPRDPDGKNPEYIDVDELERMLRAALAKCKSDFAELLGDAQSWSGASDDEFKNARIASASDAPRIIIIVVGHNSFQAKIPWGLLVQLAGGASNVMSLGCFAEKGGRIAQSAWHSEGLTNVGKWAADFVQTIGQSGDIKKMTDNYNVRSSMMDATASDIVPPDK